MERKWDECRYEMRLVSPANRRKHSVIVVGAGLAGAAAAATLGQQGYAVDCFSYHDTPRRAHSIAAQGGINAAKNYRNDGDSVLRLFKDTVKSGDFRAREANVYRLAQLSDNIIDQCVAQGVPFAREYGGLLDNRSFGGVQVERTFYARGQTGQQLLLGAYQALEEQVAAGKVTHLNSLPQGQPQRDERTLSMTAAMKNELFGSCSNHGEREAVCPKQIPLEFIGKMNRDLMRTVWRRRREPLAIPSVVQLPSAEDSHERFEEGVAQDVLETAQPSAEEPEPALPRQ
jgi:hypothetical protein